MTATIPRRYSVGLWLTAGSLAFLFCLYHLSATLVGGTFLPADPDSLYHARRILDSLSDPLRMYQFDPRIHAPEGSWITWPWAYDMLMAFAARGLVALTGARDPMTVLAFVAPAWVFVNAALFLGVASRLRLSLAMRALAMLFFVVVPLTQKLHRVGMLDHHYIEFTFVLASLYLGLGWFEEMASRRRAIALAVVLGAAPAFHNGLFILQLPVLVTVAVLWALGRPIDRRGTLAFAIALVATTALFLLPSEPFRRGEFSYYLHSSFHLYAAFSTALLCLYASRIRFSRAAVASLCVLIVALAVPVLPQLVHGRDFLFTDLPYLERIGELIGIRQLLAQGQWWEVTLTYSPALWLLPVGLGGLLWRLRRDSSNASVHFLVQSIFGSFLLLQSFRFHYFGSFALILPLCRLIDDARELRPELFASWPRRIALGAIAVVPLLACLPHLLYAYPLGDSAQYNLMRPVYAALGAACRKSPGVVLAESNDGHPIRFHTECSVIADNFITTPQHVAKVALSETLLAGSASEVMRDAPYVRYILVRRADDVLDADRRCGMQCPENAGLRRELLLAAEPPKGLRLLNEFQVRRGDRVEPYARLFEVLPPDHAAR
jgi:hypothetical protein